MSSRESGGSEQMPVGKKALDGWTPIIGPAS
jgi:hypothetical protein